MLASLYCNISREVSSLYLTYNMTKLSMTTLTCDMIYYIYTFKFQKWVLNSKYHFKSLSMDVKCSMQMKNHYFES